MALGRVIGVIPDRGWSKGVPRKPGGHPGGDAPRGEGRLLLGDQRGARTRCPSRSHEDSIGRGERSAEAAVAAVIGQGHHQVLATKE